MNRLILASKSPRRKELLSLLHIPFEIIVANIDEEINEENDLRSEIEQLSFRKAKAVFDKNQDAIVIGSDTVVHIGNKVLGKPKSIDEAKDMLRTLQGNTHEVVTAVTIMSKDKTATFSKVAEVTFSIMSEDEISEYVSTNEPMDKAGAYAIQGDGAKYIREISGDYYTIVGLPINEVYQKLKTFM